MDTIRRQVISTVFRLFATPQERLELAAARLRGICANLEQNNAAARTKE